MLLHEKASLCETSGEKLILQKEFSSPTVLTLRSNFVHYIDQVGHILSNSMPLFQAAVLCSLTCRRYGWWQEWH